MKPFAAILFAVLLAWSQFAPAPATTACGKIGKSTCAMACGGHMACCAPSAPTQPPTTPPPASAQNQIFLAIPALITWILPSQPVNLVSSVGRLPLMATGTSLYTRHCALLI